DGIYYEKLSTGSDGTSGKPITIAAESGDTPVIDRTVAATTWEPTTGGVAQVLVDGGLENWDNATTPSDWEATNDGTSSANRDGAEKHGGTYSARLDIDGSNNRGQIAQFFDAQLVSGVAYDVSVWYKTEDAKPCKFYIRVKVNSNLQYLQANDSWSTSVYYRELMNTSWTEYTTTTDAVPSGALSESSMCLKTHDAANASIYWDDVSIQYTTSYDNLYDKTFATWTGIVLEDGALLTYVLWDTDIATTYPSMSAGTYTVDESNKITYVWCTDDADPDTHTMRVSYRDDAYDGIAIDDSYIT
ncbi:unnamed protein product, partial [marine sediment metagenome]